VSIKQISTLACDSCGEQQVSQESRFGTRVPKDWAEIDIDWTDTAGDEHCDLWHLCPKCGGELLAKIMARRA
jgi:ssDNA-binding Zn-finger/Zn-ribbon topoisomerase 1